jgi:hypothetical protein
VKELCREWVRFLHSEFTCPGHCLLLGYNSLFNWQVSWVSPIDQALWGELGLSAESP